MCSFTFSMHLNIIEEGHWESGGYSHRGHFERGDAQQALNVYVSYFVTNK